MRKLAERDAKPDAKQCDGQASPHQLLWVPEIRKDKTFGAQSIKKPPLRLERRNGQSTLEGTR